jgi:FixJ family two-component response regulator
LPKAPPKINVALVDDDPAARRSLHLLLQADGFEVRSYASAGAMLGDPSAMDTACIVADYRMPGMDGLAAIKEMKARGWSGHTVLVTAYASEVREEGHQDEIVDLIIEKPFHQSAIANAVLALNSKTRVG